MGHVMRLFFFFPLHAMRGSDSVHFYDSNEDPLIEQSVFEFC